jgi:hypothetical protein
MGLLNVLNQTWGAIAGNSAAHSNEEETVQSLEALIEMRDALWCEIGRLSFGHRSHLCDDPTYAHLLKDQGRAICQNGGGEGDPLIEDLAAQARSLEERIQSLMAGSVMATPAH